MTGLWAKPGVPHKGWQCVDVYDVRADGASAEEAEYATCEMCGQERIRFVHIVEHNDFPGQLRVGCICTEKLSGDYVNPRSQENRLRRKASRKGRWLTRKWRTSAKGNEFITAEGSNLTVFPDTFRPGMWKYCIDGQYGRQSYQSSDQAKLALFEEFWRASQDEF